MRSPRSTPSSAISTATRERIGRRLAEAKEQQRRPRRLPRARGHRATRRRTCCCDRASCRRRRRRPRRSPARRVGIVALIGAPLVRSRPLQRLRHLRRRRDRRRSIASGSSPTTASSTRTATSPPARPRAARARRHARRTDDLRGHVAARPAGHRPGARRGAAARQHLSASPLPPRSATASARRCSPLARATTPCFVAFCNSVGGQDELLFDGNSLVLDEEGQCSRGGRASRRRSLVVDIEPADAIRRRLRDVRRRALARDRRRAARRSRPSTSALHTGLASAWRR